MIKFKKGDIISYTICKGDQYHFLLVLDESHKKDCVYDILILSSSFFSNANSDTLIAPMHKSHEIHYNLYTDIFHGEI